MRKPLAVALLLAAAAFPARGAPSNDSFATATAVAALPFAATLAPGDAALETGEPQPSCGGIDASVWYRYTPPADERVSFIVSPGLAGGVVAVYRGSALDGLARVACTEDATVRLAGGETHYLQLGLTADTTETIALAVEHVAPVPVPCPGCPTFGNYATPQGLDFRAGEVTIGVNPRTNATLMLLLTHTLKIVFDDSTDPPTPSWSEVSAYTTSRTTGDPILWTDPTTGRTFVAQLVPALGAIIAYTDDDGASWITTEPGIVLPSWDHQTVGTGPYAGAIASPVYPNAVYYCAQAGISASQCARSDDGGLTWGAPLPMNVGRCGGLHGHVAVGPEGTVYVPHKSCSGQQGLLVSENDGLTWDLRTAPLFPDRSDPKVAFDAAGRLYYAGASKGKPVALTSDDGGRTWRTSATLGGEFEIENTVFPMVVAGDAGRAAVGYYGTWEPGDDQSASYDGEWHLFVSFTYDGGDTWTTVDATPDDPVQRGCIWLQGGSNPCRNLLDFQDMTIDAMGRVVVGYADGCLDYCATANGTPKLSRSSLGVIARQESGLGLRAAYDGQL